MSFLQRNRQRFAYMLHSAETRLNRPLLPRLPASSFLDEWEGVNAFRDLTDARPRLLITITTYRRPAELRALIEALAQHRALQGPDTWVCILNDRSEADYTGAREALTRGFAGRHLWLDARAQMGKQRFWRTHQTIFLAARAAQAEFLLSLQDDIEVPPDFLDRLWEVWEATGRDVARRVLYLFSNTDDEERGRWIEFQRIASPDIPARRTDWFDLQGFLIDRRGLALLRYWVIPVSPWYWRRGSAHSSGVGRQFTRRLFGRATTWQCDPPLIFHGASQSEMNAEVRRQVPLDNRALFPGRGATS